IEPAELAVRLDDQDPLEKLRATDARGQAGEAGADDDNVVVGRGGHARRSETGSAPDRGSPAEAAGTRARARSLVVGVWAPVYLPIAVNFGVRYSAQLSSDASCM